MLEIDDYFILRKGDIEWQEPVSIEQTDFVDQDLARLIRTKGKEHPFLKEYYKNNYEGWSSSLTYEEFVDELPFIFWQDPFGRIIKIDTGLFPESQG